MNALLVGVGASQHDEKVKRMLFMKLLEVMLQKPPTPPENVALCTLFTQWFLQYSSSSSPSSSSESILKREVAENFLQQIATLDPSSFVSSFPSLTLLQILRSASSSPSAISFILLVLQWKQGKLCY